MTATTGQAAGNEGLLHLLAHVAGKSAIRVAVVHPCDALSLSATLEARAEGLIEPILVAPRPKLEAVAGQAGWSWPAWPSRTCRTATPPPRARSNWPARDRSRP